ncbi:hypothetical protein O6H91_03G029500 [Diphasiastrum complanatum]|uniref:Uncharacterized protein n=2 Tax=Diphasiastrum complanatum TaxID=34168 RepID=A0ACC2E4H3_DIPCM|nr:hypothetical protein O6H91_03G029500 [Diphasiastrum complanatum]KAJ7561464.1 hypothetical protein O6H91_03G029500 [Diphasiastrum complanatum]
MADGQGGVRVLGMEELSKLSLEQIRQVKEQVDAELNLLQDSLTNIRTAANRFEMAAKALNTLSQQPAGKKLLVPLTASLYVPGKLENTGKVLVDVGTGYYIEKTLPDGKDYCDRKINFLKENHDKLVEVAAEKRNASEQVTMLVQKKLQQSLPAK